MNLQESSDHKASILLPVTIISAFMMVVGVVGNATVVLVITTRMSKKAINCFVLALAAADLFSCVICVPMDLVELRYPYLFTFSSLCKLLRFSRSLSTTTSGFLLIAIATERYRLICKYHKSHFSGKQALMICSLVLALSLTVSWPSIVLFGSKTVSVANDITGTECSISDAFKHSDYPVVYYSVLIVLFFGTFISLCVLYALVGLKIWKKLKSKKFSDIRSYSFSSLQREKINNNSDLRVSEVLKISEVCESLRRGTSLFSEKGQKCKDYSRRRTTFIMVVMTSVFLVSCLPYIVISICRFLTDDIDLHISEAAEVFFHVSLKSFMFSAAINPYIYGFCNERFKTELFRLPIINRIVHRSERGETSDTSQSLQYSTAVTEEVDRSTQSAGKVG